MIVLTIRTDKPEAEIGLFSDQNQLYYKKWQAHRELSATIHKKIEEVLLEQELSWHNLEGILIYKGPGSFTGLRIGFSVANTLCYGQNIPIVSEGTEKWIKNGIKRLTNGENEKIATPCYGSDAHTTKPKK